MAGYGYRGARTAVRLIDDPSRFLATVQIGITLVGILAGAFGGATLAYRLGDWLNGFPALAPNGDSIAIAVVVVVIAYLSLIAGELVPKRIALTNPERVAARSEEHTSELQSLMRISYAVFCLKKKKTV